MSLSFRLSVREVKQPVSDKQNDTDREIFAFEANILMALGEGAACKSNKVVCRGTCVIDKPS
jgi:hypothetical protein